MIPPIRMTLRWSLICWFPLIGWGEATFDGPTRAKAMAVLQAGLASDEFWPAMHAAEALTLAGETARVRRALGPRLPRETDDQRRCGLARELVRAGDANKAAVMIAILATPESNGRIHAAESLYKVGWRGDAETYLQAAIAEDSNYVLRLMARAALAKHGSGADRERALSALRASLQTERDHNNLRLIAWVLARVGDASDIARIRPLLDRDLEARPRVFVEHALARLGDPEGRRALQRNLQSDDAATRTYAAVFAGECGMTETVPRLVAQLDDPNLDARIRAAQALFVLENLQP